MPYFLKHKRARAAGGGGVGVSRRGGLVATLAAMAGDKLRARFAGSYFWCRAWRCDCFPLMLAMVRGRFLRFGFYVRRVLLPVLQHGPTNTILANVTHPSLRATAFAVNIL